MDRLALIAVSSLLLFSIVANASYLKIYDPIPATIYNNGSIYLGKVGPGESFYISASAGTTNSSGTYVNVGWNILKSIELPVGWSSQASQLYSDPMRMKIRVSPDAANGTYAIKLRAVNLQNYSKLGNLTFTVYVNVTSDVFNLNVSPTNINSGIGVPVNLQVIINNTGISDDPFNITSYGLPAWNETYWVISLHGTEDRFVYPVIINEPGSYSFNLSVTSSTSPLISKSYNIKLLAAAGLANDYSALSQGAILYPIIYEPAYAVMQLLSYIYKGASGR